jgi:hypothetical protein
LPDALTENGSNGEPVSIVSLLRMYESADLKISVSLVSRLQSA